VKIKIRKAVASALTTVAATVALAAGLTGTAHAAAVPAPTAQMTRTCQAYAAWYYHRTTANADAMVAGTFTGTWTSTGARYILRDVTQLYTDIRGGAALKYVNEDITYTGTDCNRYVLGIG
jgi:hypothetical protein